MPSTFNSESEKAQPLVYQIRIKGHLGREWADWFGGLTLTLEDNGETLLTGPVVDQAALYGLLRKVRDVAMPLLSVVCVTPGQVEASDVKQEMNDRIKANTEGDPNESDCVYKIRITGCSSIQRGRKTCPQGR